MESTYIAVALGASPSILLVGVILMLGGSI